MSKQSPVTPTLEECYLVISDLRKDVDRLELMLRQMMFETREEEEVETGAADGVSLAWRPPADDAPVDGIDAISLRIQRVTSKNRNGDDILTRLRDSWLGRFYRRYLKRYTIVRRLVMWLWRHGYPIYMNRPTMFWSRNRNRRWSRLVKLSAFANRAGVETHRLTDPRVVTTPTPKVLPVKEQAYLETPDASYAFPGIFVVSVNDARVQGGTNLVQVGNETLCHDLYDFARDYTSEELHGRTRIDVKHNKIRWQSQDDEPESVAEAASFLDACAFNYAHWLTEVLPRICLFCSDVRFRDVPIIVDDGLHANILKSLFYTVGAQREVITLPAGRGLMITKLHVVSPSGYVPFDRRNDALTNHSEGVFSPDALNLLRKHISQAISWRPGRDWPDKLYLRRNSGARRLVNGEALEHILAGHGYVIVETERLNFAEQVLLFENAKHVIAPTGAACANLIFCKPGAHVVILMGKHERMPYRYWLNMAAPLGVTVNYVLGDIVDALHLGIHGNFKVCPDDLLDAAIMLERS